MSDHWITQYIGKPWVTNGRGPDGFDCWGFVWWVYKHHFGIELERGLYVNPRDLLSVARELDGGIPTHQGIWDRVEVPVDGCGVAMSQHTRIHHVGVYLEVDGGMVFHCADAHFVTGSSLDYLKNVLRYNRIEFYVHKDFDGHGCSSN